MVVRLGEDEDVGVDAPMRRGQPAHDGAVARSRVGGGGVAATEVTVEAAVKAAANGVERLKVELIGSLLASAEYEELYEVAKNGARRTCSGACHSFPG